MSLYYEAHITIEPVFDEALERFKKLCEVHKFKAADLLMKKRAEDTAERSQYDTFCTGRSQSYSDLANRMCMLIADLKNDNFHVWRYKIESTVMDSRHYDILRMIDEKPSTDR